MLKAGKNQTDIYIDRIIEYDVKSSQVKITIVRRTKMQIKEKMVDRSRKTAGMANKYMTQSNKLM